MLDNLEIEAKFLEIDKPALIEKLHKLGAEDKGEDKITQMIFYDQKGEWKKNKRKFVRIRKTMNKAFLAYKDHFDDTATGVTEYETEVKDVEQVKNILEVLGLVMSRHDEKIRHKFILDEVIVDIDTWPGAPTFVELEGPSEDSLKDMAKKLGFDWKDAVFGLSGAVLEKKYGIPIFDLTYLTFDKIE